MIEHQSGCTLVCSASQLQYIVILNRHFYYFVHPIYRNEAGLTAHFCVMECYSIAAQTTISKMIIRLNPVETKTI